MTYTKSPELEFKQKLASLDKESLKVLFEELKAEEAPLGMLMAVSREYTSR